MSRRLILRVVVDNQAQEGLATEHGFAAWITIGTKNFLLDTGAGDALQTNADRLKIDLADAEALVLSHGHYDHSGGLPDFLEHNETAKVFVGPGVDVSRYACHAGKPPHDAGMRPEVRLLLRSLAAVRLQEVTEPVRLCDGVGATGPIPRVCRFEDTGGPFFLDPGKAAADTIADEQAIWFETANGLVIAVGCCHAGIVNTTDHIRRVSGIERVCGIVGGLHLNAASEARMSATVEALTAMNLDFLIPCHCTGNLAMSRLTDALGAGVVEIGRAGMTADLGRME